MRAFLTYSLALAVVGGALALLIMLGLWQLDRLAWKENLLTAIDSNRERPAMPLATALDLSEAEQTFLPVQLEGAFVAEPVIFYGLRLHNKRSGYQVLLPFRTTLTAKNSSVADYTILVNLGWVPQAAFPDWRPPAPLSRVTTLTGRLRPQEKPTWFTPANQPATNTWQTIHPDEMAAYYGLYPSLPYWVQLTEPLAGEGWPEPVTKIPQLPNNHLKYALTWFALAGGLVMMTGYAVWRRQR